MARQTLEPTPRELNIIKKNPVDIAAALCGRSRQIVRRWRHKYFPGQPPKPGRPRRQLPVSLLEALGKQPDAVLAREHGLPKNTVRNYRIERDIPPCPRPSADLEASAA